MFVPGQLVKHIRDWSCRVSVNWREERRHLANLPDDGRIYTIRTINRWPDGVLVTLVECDNSHLARNGWEPGFNARHFRPLDDSRLDVFRKALTDAPQDTELVE